MLRVYIREVCFSDLTPKALIYGRNPALSLEGAGSQCVRIHLEFEVEVEIDHLRCRTE